MAGYLKRLQEAIDLSVEGIAPEDLLCHPEGKWSVADILEHLSLTYTGTIKACGRCLGLGMPLAAKTTLKNRLQQFVVITCGHMPSGREAPERTRPSGTAGETVRTEIAAKIVAMEDALQRCESRFGPDTRLMNHPVLGPLTAGQWQKFHWVHGWHHVRQIRQLRESGRRKFGAGPGVPAPKHY